MAMRAGSQRKMSDKSSTIRNKLTRSFSGVAGRFYAGIAAGIVALIALAIFGSVAISTVLTEQKKTELKHLVETAVSIVADFEARAKRGEMPEDEAKKRASETLRILRYSGSEYFFIQLSIRSLSSMQWLGGGGRDHQRICNTRHFIKHKSWWYFAIGRIP